MYRCASPITNVLVLAWTCLPHWVTVQADAFSQSSGRVDNELTRPTTQLTETLGNTSSTLPNGFGTSTSFVDIMLNLVVVLVAIVLLAWIVKRVQGMDHPSAGQLHVAASLPLGPKERLLVVQVGEQQLLLGATQTGINTLHVLEKPLVIVRPDTESFSDKLRNSLKSTST